MSYTKQTWATGDTITAQKLNHMEDGIAGAGGVMVVSTTYDESTMTTTLDKTWQEIFDAIASGAVVTVPQVSLDGTAAGYGYVQGCKIRSAAYKVTAKNSDGETWDFSATSPNGYPQSSLE